MKRLGFLLSAAALITLVGAGAAAAENFSIDFDGAFSPTGGQAISINGSWIGDQNGVLSSGNASLQGYVEGVGYTGDPNDSDDLNTLQSGNFDGYTYALTDADGTSGIYFDFSASLAPDGTGSFNSGGPERFSTVTGGGGTVSDASQFSIGFITPLAAAPEPSGWALMIAGVSLVGAALRNAGAHRRQLA